jgi:hypothetical protein
MPLVYVPEMEKLFLWGDGAAPREAAGIDLSGKRAMADVVTPEGRRTVHGAELALLDTAAMLAVVPAAELEALPASIATWTLASKLAMELLARERVVPTIARSGGRIEARWAAALSASEDAAKVAAIAESMSPAAHAVPLHAGSSLDVWAPDALVRAYLDAVIDALLRASQKVAAVPSAKPARGGARQPWDARWRAALVSKERAFEASGFEERSVLDEIEGWSEPAVGARDRLRACFRLELPADDGAAFVLRFVLQSPDDPSLLIEASEVWKTRSRTFQKLGRAFRDPQESLLQALGRAALLYAPIERALDWMRPEMIELSPAEAWTFLGEGAAALGEAGFGVIVPSELTSAGQRRLRLRARIGGAHKVAGAVAGAAQLGMEELLDVDWQAAIGDQVLSDRDIALLAKLKAPLVRFRGAWTAIDQRELREIRERISAGPGRMQMIDALQAVLAGELREGALPASVEAVGSLADVVERLRQGGATDLRAPQALCATLRPYQQRGFAWLATMASLGLGACLADDMGLGKTMQLLAFLLHRMEVAARDPRPALLIAPTSVLGNWEREIERFAPSLRVTAHYGSTRVRDVSELPREAGSLVLTTYGLLRRDVQLLRQVDWSVLALDEAQNIKNSASATARAARALRASHRFALTGTPVENRLAELWSILELANPGLLGPLEKFRRDFAVPIERYRNEEAAARLRKLVSPFILRRLKSDPTVIADLPAKNEMKVVCTLTPEQATLYKAVVNEEMRRIEQAEGIERKGRVLALLTYTKQICNHPAQYLSEKGPLAQRSGKLARVTEMLEEALAAGDKALVFTQFRDMGDKLTAHLQARLGGEVLFLHGGTAKGARDKMVQRFQEEPHGPRVFVLSVKAGGTGLNLTAANHVFHYDRWWNPAVEDQATDRAYRIGQTRNVQVHKLLCAGTVEEKIDALLEHKRDLAHKVVGAGEQWITELGTSDLRALFSLSKEAVELPDDDDAGGDAPDATHEEARA